MAEVPKREDAHINPLSPYAVTKATGEFYCKVFHEIYDLATVSLRYFNVFGPRQDPTSQYAAVIPRFITAILTNAPHNIRRRAAEQEFHVRQSRRAGEHSRL